MGEGVALARLRLRMTGTLEVGGGVTRGRREGMVLARRAPPISTMAGCLTEATSVLRGSQ
jgi:hypothetical protein